MTRGRFLLVWYVGVLLAACAVIKSGCAAPAANSTPAAVVDVGHGIPNFQQVRADWWRSGQPPATHAAWAYLAREGFTDVAKFDFPGEGEDSAAEESIAAEYGIRVHQFGINPTTEILDAIASFGGTELLPPEGSVIAKVREFIEDVRRENAAGGHRKVLGHCIYGRDRTGFFMAMVRVLNGDMTKAQAQREMLEKGFRRVHWGLWRAWVDFDPAEGGR